MLILPATLTSREARDTLQMLRQAMQNEAAEGPVVVDAGPLQHLDSAAIAVLLEIQRLAGAWGRAFAVRAAPAKLVALAHLYGLDVLLLQADAGVAVTAAAVAAQRRPAT